MNDTQAFPKIKTRQALKDKHREGNAYGEVYSEGGLTKREYFAAKAMSGILANPFYADWVRGNNASPVVSTVAAMALEAADELIKRLNSDQEKGGNG